MKANATRVVRVGLDLPTTSFHNLLKNARSNSFNLKSSYGYEIADICSNSVRISFTERITNEKVIEYFGSQKETYEEIKIVNFEILFVKDSRFALFINPPRSPRYINKCCSELVSESQPFIMGVKVLESLRKLIKSNQGTVSYAESDFIVVAQNKKVKVAVSGIGNLLELANKYLESSPHHLKKSVISIKDKFNHTLQLELRESGTLIFSDEVDDESLVSILKSVV